MKKLILLLPLFLFACSPEPAQDEKVSSQETTSTLMEIQSVLNWPGVMFFDGQAQTELPEIEPNVFFIDLPPGQIPDNSELMLITKDYFVVIQIVKSRPLTVKIAFANPENSITYLVNKNDLLITSQSGNLLTIRFK